MPTPKQMKRVLKWLLLLAIAAIVVAWLFYQATHPANHYSQEQLRPYRNAQEWTLYSIDPSVRGEALPDSFQGYLALGSHRVSDPKLLQQVVQELDEAAEMWGGSLAMCFNPRHGIRVTSGDKTFDMVICYECSRVYLYEGSDEVGIMYLTTDPQRELSPNKLNDLLTKAGIKLPAQPRHSR